MVVLVQSISGVLVALDCSLVVAFTYDLDDVTQELLEAHRKNPIWTFEFCSTDPAR